MLGNMGEGVDSLGDLANAGGGRGFLGLRCFLRHSKLGSSRFAGHLAVGCSGGLWFLDVGCAGAEDTLRGGLLVGSGGGSALGRATARLGRGGGAGCAGSPGWHGGWWWLREEEREVLVAEQREPFSRPKDPEKLNADANARVT